MAPGVAGGTVVGGTRDCSNCLRCAQLSQSEKTKKGKKSRPTTRVLIRSCTEREMKARGG